MKIMVLVWYYSDDLHQMYMKNNNHIFLFKRDIYEHFHFLEDRIK